MIDLRQLKEIIDESGKSPEYLAAAMGLSRQGYYNKLTGKSDFKTEEVNALCKALGINSVSMRDKIFFARKVENIST